MSICLILILIYCLLVKIQHGNFGLTNVSSINKISSIIISDTYVSGNNKNITDMINSEISGINFDGNYFSCAKKIIKNFERNEINEYCSNVYKNDTKKYIFYTLQNALGLGSKNIGTKYVNYTIDYSSKTYKALVLLLKNKKIAWILAFLLSMICGSLFTTIIGSSGEYQRLFLSSLPLTIILITYLTNVVLQSINIKTTNNILMEIN
ncbi:MAG: hypothetical protein PHD15_03560 [Clostridia bacterium]|nr:hypothetical protein [Clostridia bacterium]MDD4386819.1 hypothetical protein [Clostridia bacterium]